MRPPGVIRSNSTGTLTALFANPGDSIANGARLFDINGSPVFAMTQDPPLYRDLQPGMTGADVAAMQRFLIEGRFLPDTPSNVGGRFDSNTSKAVCAFQKANGLPCTGRFALSNVAYVPKNALAVRRAIVAVGDHVDVGASVLEAIAEPISATIRPSADNGSLAIFAEDPVVLSSPSGAEVVLANKGHLTGDQVNMVYQMALKDGTTSNPGSAASDSDTSTYEGLLLQKQTPTIVATVPGTSVFVASNGTKCVIKVSSASSSRATEYHVTTLQKVIPAAGQIGQVYADPAIVGSSILRDPQAAPASTLSKCR